MTLEISGLRMSARTNSARPIRRSRSRGGGTVSTPSTRSMSRVGREPGGEVTTEEPADAGDEHDG